MTAERCPDWGSRIWKRLWTSKLLLLTVFPPRILRGTSPLPVRCDAAQVTIPPQPHSTVMQQGTKAANTSKAVTRQVLGAFCLARIIHSVASNVLSPDIKKQTLAISRQYGVGLVLLLHKAAATKARLENFRAPEDSQCFLRNLIKSTLLTTTTYFMGCALTSKKGLRRRLLEGSKPQS
ncbi:hypothetical protein WISP_75638 [Willisornis vidua]|uniref:Uncharacterized protein n=1 Tax=Willisornis vidua TaxID=1566151 RepID=A0ABQ9D6A8_9PASS|nr:hypothetical protein WISP_75638 [Willisornis vidua]